MINLLIFFLTTKRFRLYGGFRNGEFIIHRRFLMFFWVQEFRGTLEEMEFWSRLTLVNSEEDKELRSLYLCLKTYLENL